MQSRAVAQQALAQCGSHSAQRQGCCGGCADDDGLGGEGGVEESRVEEGVGGRDGSGGEGGGMMQLLSILNSGSIAHKTRRDTDIYMTHTYIMIFTHTHT